MYSTQLPGFLTNPYFLPSKCRFTTSRRQPHPYCNTQPPSPPSDDTSSNDETHPGGPGGPYISSGRFPEFSSFEGDRSLQNNLASELQWTVQKYSSAQTLSNMVETEITRTSEDLAEMYSRGERILKEKNEVLALRLSVGDIGRWNEVVREGHRACEEMRGEILEEMEIVEGLLKAAKRKQGNVRKKRKRKVKKSEGVAGMMVGSLMFAGLGWQMLEVIAKQEQGAQNLIKFGLWSSVPILLLACFGNVNERGNVRAKTLQLRDVDASLRGDDDVDDQS